MCANSQRKARSPTFWARSWHEKKVRSLVAFSLTRSATRGYNDFIMSVSVVTTVALPRYNSQLTAEQARDFARVLCYRMELTRAEWLALVNSPVAWARSRDERGMIWFNGEHRAVHGWEGPRPVEIQPELAVNMMIRTIQWISALRGKVAKRGSLVCVQYCGHIVFGRVTRKNSDGTLRVVMDEDQIGFPKFTTGVYNNRTLTSVEPEMCAVLTR